VYIVILCKNSKKNIVIIILLCISLYKQETTIINVSMMRFGVCRFYEPDAVLEDEEIEKNRIAAYYTRFHAFQEHSTETGILCGHHHAHGCRVS